MIVIKNIKIKKFEHLEGKSKAGKDYSFWKANCVDDEGERIDFTVANKLRDEMGETKMKEVSNEEVKATIDITQRGFNIQAELLEIE